MQEWVVTLNAIVTSICQILAILVITIGVIKAMIIYIKDALFGEKAAEAIQESRLELGHSFSLGLGFLIGASIISTTIAPTWEDIGQLASVIAIRTVLNHFLLTDIKNHSNHSKKKAPKEDD